MSISDADTDHDSIPDGREIKGYEVKIITGWKKDGTPKSVMKAIDSSYLDPLIPYGYNSTEGFKWCDSDDDGIPELLRAFSPILHTSWISTISRIKRTG